MNVDIAIRDSYAVIAAILQDCQGAILGDLVKKIVVVDPLESEVEAAKLGMELVINQGFREVILEGDSEIVIKAIQKWPQKTE